MITVGTPCDVVFDDLTGDRVLVTAQVLLQFADGLACFVLLGADLFDFGLLLGGRERRVG